MNETHNPHDQYFKETLAQPGAAVDFLRYYLPERIVRLIEPETAERIEDSFVDEELKEHLSDLLFRVKLKNKGAAFIYVLLEHKSSPDKWVALQLLRYLVRIWEKAQREGKRKLPLVFPVVFYHGKTRWKISGKFSALFEFGDELDALREFVPEFDYHLCDLARFDDTQLKGEAGLLTAMRLLKHIFRRELKAKLNEALRPVAERLPDEQALERLKVASIYLAQTGRATGKEILAAIEAAKKGEKAMETFLDEWMREGRKQGLQQGLQQGETELVLRLLRRRFKRLDGENEARIRELSRTQVESLAEALLDFKKSADLTKWLEKNAANKTN